MKGYIKLESVTHEGKEGLCVETKLRDVSRMDRILMVSGVCSALHITPAELKLMAGLLGSGFMEEMTDTVTMEDEPESDTAKKTPITGRDVEAVLELLKDMLG